MEAVTDKNDGAVNAKATATKQHFAKALRLKICKAHVLPGWAQHQRLLPVTIQNYMKNCDSRKAQKKSLSRITAAKY